MVIQSNTAKLAQSYFTEPNGDFKTVCTLAGFDHEYIRMKAKKFLERKKKKMAKKICPRCNGNGYFKVKKEVKWPSKEEKNCGSMSTMYSEGEIEDVDSKTN